MDKNGEAYVETQSVLQNENNSSQHDTNRDILENTSRKDKAVASSSSNSVQEGFKGQLPDPFSSTLKNEDLSNISKEELSPKTSKIKRNLGRTSSKDLIVEGKTDNVEAEKKFEHLKEESEATLDLAKYSNQDLYTRSTSRKRVAGRKKNSFSLVKIDNARAESDGKNIQVDNRTGQPEKSEPSNDLTPASSTLRDPPKAEPEAGLDLEKYSNQDLYTRLTSRNRVTGRKNYSIKDKKGNGEIETQSDGKNVPADSRVRQPEKAELSKNSSPDLTTIKDPSKRLISRKRNSEKKDPLQDILTYPRLEPYKVK